MDSIDEKLTEALASSGITLDEAQPHISGERFLLSPAKLVLLGKDREGRQVVIKASNTKGQRGIEEITQEKKIRDTLGRINFAKDSLLIPEERLFTSANGYTILATDFIEQERIFIKHSLEEQFFLILRAFEAQEALHATTYEHVRQVAPIFKSTTPEQYCANFSSFRLQIEMNYPDSELTLSFTRGEEILKENISVLSRYANYLSHTDFVPHNMRVKNRSVYILDQVAIEFANKYEGWARLLNYMIVHNPALERLLALHLAKNRSADENLDLKLMRIYKAGFLLNYYASVLPKTEGNLRALTLERLGLWTHILEALLEGREVESKFVEEYKNRRGELRTEEEKERQRDFAEA